MSAELRVAEPLKSRLILEMATDLEALAEHFRARGMSEGEAAAEAELRLLASPQALNALVRLHTTGLERVAMRVAWSVRSGLDLFFFLFGLSPLVIAAGIGVSAQLAVGIGFEGWPIVALGLVLVILMGRIEWALRRASAVDRQLRFRVADILYLGVLAIAVGLTTFVFQLIVLFGGLTTRGGDAVYLAGQLTTVATSLALALLVCIGCGLSWFVSVHRLAARERAESLALLGV